MKKGHLFPKKSQQAWEGGSEAGECQLSSVQPYCSQSWASLFTAPPPAIHSLSHQCPIYLHHGPWQNLSLSCLSVHSLDCKLYEEGTCWICLLFQAQSRCSVNVELVNGTNTGFKLTLSPAHPCLAVPPLSGPQASQLWNRGCIQWPLRSLLTLTT